jgi:hypothetical protein
MSGGVSAMRTPPDGRVRMAVRPDPSDSRAPWPSGVRQCLHPARPHACAAPSTPGVRSGPRCSPHARRVSIVVSALRRRARIRQRCQPRTGWLDHQGVRTAPGQRCEDSGGGRAGPDRRSGGDVDRLQLVAQTRGPEVRFGGCAAPARCAAAIHSPPSWSMRGRNLLSNLSVLAPNAAADGVRRGRSSARPPGGGPPAYRAAANHPIRPDKAYDNHRYRGYLARAGSRRRPPTGMEWFAWVGRNAAGKLSVLYLEADDSAQHRGGAPLPRYRSRAGMPSSSSRALVLARPVDVAVAEVPVHPQQRPARTVRAPATGRRELTQLWAAGHHHAARPCPAPASRTAPCMAHQSDLLRGQLRRVDRMQHPHRRA